MDIYGWITLGVMGLVCVLLWFGAAKIERRWQRNHPPDDGVREDDERDENPRL